MALAMTFDSFDDIAAFGAEQADNNTIGERDGRN